MRTYILYIKKRGKLMGKHPKLDTLEKFFNSNKNFSLTDAQYEARTGIPLPKSIRYLINNSALAKKSKKYGYKLEVQEKIVYFIKENN